MFAIAEAVADAAQSPEVAFWSSSYALAAIGIVLTQAMLIAGLLIQRERRQRAERALRRGQSDLQASYVRIRDLGGLHSFPTRRSSDLDRKSVV